MKSYTGYSKGFDDEEEDPGLPPKMASAPAKYGAKKKATRKKPVQQQAASKMSKAPVFKAQVMKKMAYDSDGSNGSIEDDEDHDDVEDNEEGSFVAAKSTMQAKSADLFQAQRTKMAQKAAQPRPDTEGLIDSLVFRRAYQQAVENGDPQPWGWSKLMIIGQGAAGKTSTVRSLLGLDPVETWESTVGVDLKVTSADDWKQRDHAETDFNLMLHKAAAQIVKEGEHPRQAGAKSKGPAPERTSRRFSKTVLGFFGLRRSSAKSAKTGDAAPASEMEEEVDHDGAAQNAAAPPASLMEQEEVARAINLDWARKLTNSEDTPLRFAIWDYGGQDVFYALHHVFLTKYGVYVLVFDMRQILADQESVIEYLRFWLNSVKLHAPNAPIVMVGTYADEVTTDDEYQRIEGILRRDVGTKLLVQVIKDSEARRSFFPMNNASASPTRGEKLRQIIENCAADQDYVKQKVSLRWIRILTDLVEDSAQQYVSMAHVRSLGSSYGVTGEELSHMLRFFNEIGALVHLDANETLSKNVVTQPQWLLNKLSRVIADEMHIESLYYDPELQRLGLAEDFERMRKMGVASYELLDFLWDGDEVDFLIEFMNSAMLLSPWPFNDKREYLVTSLLRDDSDTLAAEQGDGAQAIDPSEFEGGAACALDFSEFYLPDGVFQRLVPICAEYSARDEDSSLPRLSRQSAQIAFGWNEFLLEADHGQDIIRITFKPDAEDVGENIKVIVSMFRALKDNVMQNLKWKLVLFSQKNPAQGADYEDLVGARARKASKVRDTQGRAAKVSEFGIFFQSEETLGSLVSDESGGESSTSTAPADLTQDAAAATSEGFDVFISHKQSSGGDQVAILYEKLQQHGLRVWFDERMPVITKPAMEEGVKHSSAFLLFLSRGVFSSGYVKFELQTALEAGKPIILVHESDTQRLGYSDFGEYIQTAPVFAQEARLFELVESIPFQRRYYLEKPFVDELSKRIRAATAAHTH
ncbi:Leucine-rich repeat serine/threonine-protein kinase 2 [Hondaea fermentalgiana]|uniref:non-specific serine/threonine protein kinase n=1 Tax=Hondaea fermentalgiana TaxID=2315210 RepID=A0A2R5GBG1_9STRA|nr:Leucine-rich repeat serine/threonine-protein kinase 2 [Hondaea fermentalgiana]|eukprot:GBG25054.1 Leucine-rich repeat serine/threonine-protein kinase 2 [Hondaea fermentalgiana]